MIRSLSLFFVSLPFLFGLLRASTTGSDFRYLWVAAAAMLGAAAVTAATRRQMRRLRVAFVLAAASFVVATICATAAAILLGTRIGAGLLIVASSFAFCCALGSMLFAITGR